MPGELRQSAADAMESEAQFTRYDGQYQNRSEGFRLRGRDFQRQYFHIYSYRLATMRPRVEACVRQTQVGGPDVNVISLSELSRHKGQDVVLIGTLYKHQELKPNILKDLSEDRGLLPQPRHVKYISPDDDLILEDNLQRIRLRGQLNLDQLVTGVVCGVYGREEESGKFEVVQLVFAAPLAQPARTIPEKDRVTPPHQIEYPLSLDSLVVLLSGLELGDAQGRSLAAFQLAVDWIIGEAGQRDEQRENAQIQRVIIAGNALDESTQDKAELAKAKYLTQDLEAGSTEAIKQLDHFLVQLAGSVDVDIMPGAFDPANQTLPQQPLHMCLFPTANVFATLHSVTNPYQFEVEGTRCLGTSGQITDDIIRNTSLDTATQAMESLLTWSHLAPTAPDTLGCFPYADQDPFIMSELPHLMFSGNQKKFDYQLTKRTGGSEVGLLSIPKFRESHSIVVWHSKSMTCEEITFDASLEAEWLK
eukprot:snap_masked-scaffold2012_size22666-processed-gene-0.7 protein:Tk01851 transcript:snap_masked-scaffold2012_size22666-processed-gene-0.7-mRNA-1 annotation:"hypothetical protein LOTGIDRAFT_106607"